MTSRPRAKPILTVTIAALVFVVLTLAPTPAAAHANLVESSPQPSEELDAPPERVIIWFTEPIEPAFSAISVRDRSGAEVTDGETQFEPTETTAMWVRLTELQNGTYTVAWRNVSSVDGHKVTGSFLFAVGESLGAGSDAEAEQQPILVSPFEPLVRWFIYIGIAVFAGGLVFELLVVTRATRSEDLSDPISFAQTTSIRFTTVALGAIMIVLLAQIGQLILQTYLAFDDAIAAINPSRLTQVITQSEWGSFWSWRFTAGVLAAIGLFGARQAVKRADHESDPDEFEDTPLSTETPWGVAAIALGGVYLLLIALTSHNAATPEDIRGFAIAADLVHVISATIWVGGIVYLAVASFQALRSDEPQSRAMLLSLASRFAPVAIFATTILVGSGIVSSLMQVTIPEALNTPYGRVLGVKIILLAILIGLAVRNNRTVAKHIKNDTAEARPLGRNIVVELGVAFAVLLATAGLASIEPARQYAERTGIGVEDYVSYADSIAGANIDVALDPGSTGSNKLAVAITDSQGNPFQHADEVRARVKYLDDDFGEYFVPMENPSPGRWKLDDIIIGVTGAYQLDVTVVRSDAFDSHVSTRFSAKSSTFASDLIRPSAQTAMLAFGVLIAVAGIAYLIIATFSRQSARTRFAIHHGVGGLITVIGVLLTLNTLTIGIGLPTAGKGNPFPLNQESVDAGLATYTASCSTCHGETGRGDGPAGLALNPPPADLAIHVPLHTDDELYSFIADGIEGTLMVAQLGNLTSDEIWHLVNYIRTMSE